MTPLPDFPILAVVGSEETKTMSDSDTSEAWVKIPTPTEREAMKDKDDPYDFGFIPAMGGLILTHPEIGPKFFELYGQIMFAPGGALDRAEREMTASVAAAAQDCFY
jgi:alkylhydroperoxidase/carboxymuconolactone decarboxylase family protein YurZ